VFDEIKEGEEEDDEEEKELRSKVMMTSGDDNRGLNESPKDASGGTASGYLHGEGVTTSGAMYMTDR
jgi:hypothetical protein